MAARKTKTNIFKKEEELDSVRQRFAGQLKVLLNELGCPLTELMDDTSILEQLLNAGDFRLSLLCWLFGRFDSAVDEYLETILAGSADATRDKRLDVLSQALHRVIMSLGLCSQDDAAIVTGQKGGSAQLGFLQRLCDWMRLSELSESSSQSDIAFPAMSGSIYSASSSSSVKHTRLRKQFEEDSILIDALTSHQPINSLLSNRSSLIPLEIGRQIETDRARSSSLQMSGGGDCRGRPLSISAAASGSLNIEDLENEIERLETELEEKKKALIQLTGSQQALSFLSDDPHNQSSAVMSADSMFETIPEAMKQTVRLVLADLDQVIVSFSYFYDNDMKHWCAGRTMPEVNETGSKFKRVHGLLKQFCDLTSSIETILKCHYNLSFNHHQTVEQLRRQLSHRPASADSTISTGRSHGSTSASDARRSDNILDTLRDTATELERSVSRLDLTSVTTQGQRTASLLSLNQSAASLPTNEASQRGASVMGHRGAVNSAATRYNPYLYSEM